MTRPEEAVGAARCRRGCRERGEYADDLGGLTVPPTDATTAEKLLEGALIEPDVDLVDSTRLSGGPITAFKRALVWTLRQYNGRVLGQQTRFNHHIVLHARRLEDQVAELEQPIAAHEREKERGDEA
jgi:hypothetical protein